MCRQRYTIPYVVRRKSERAMAANAEKEQVDNPLNLHSSKLHFTASAPMDDSKPTAASRGSSRSRNRSRSRGRSVSRSRRRSASRSKFVVRSGNQSPLINPESERGISSTWADKVKGLIGNDGQGANYQRTIFRQQMACLGRWCANQAGKGHALRPTCRAIHSGCHGKCWIRGSGLPMNPELSERQNFLCTDGEWHNNAPLQPSRCASRRRS
ncbi:hypothetical protein HPB51_025052 [Rhipicephalus microplus]|uniref:Uncharacterized protein n=1 Tax=Rhipicephalus microplus TaxID=6941 RepID=A0A9J6EVT7_RHIMP|nr:hypothetical protein HPB51_025052 [Rhipicephalus microplus]